MIRQYNVYWFRDDKKTSGKLNNQPMSHEQAIAFKSRLADYPWRRLALVEV